MKKKIISLILAVVICISLGMPAYASNINYEGTVIYESNSAMVRNSSGGHHIVVSAVDNPDGSITLYQYTDEFLIEEHTTFPGSGIVNHTYYDENGNMTFVTETTTQSPIQQDTNLMPLSTNTRNLGIIYYRLNATTQYSIACHVVEDIHVNEPYTFYEEDVRTISGWIADIISFYAFFTNPTSIALKIIHFMDDYNIMSIVEEVAVVLISKTITCTYYNQTIYGNCTSHSGYPQGSLQGVLAYVNTDGNVDIIRENYTTFDWGNYAMGRQMIYQVLGIDDGPTGWTNLDV